METLLELRALIGIQYRHDFLPLRMHARTTLTAIGDALVLRAVLLMDGLDPRFLTGREIQALEKRRMMMTLGRSRRRCGLRCRLRERGAGLYNRGGDEYRDGSTNEHVDSSV
ncbi:MAG TPA: hypothetical protein VGG22_03100 [Candidatus Baltobacteraceae bacterium]